MFVNYDSNGASGTAPSDGNNYDPGADVTVLGQGTLTRTNYTFTGWNTESDGSGTHYDENDHFDMPDEDVYLYAEWCRDLSTLTSSEFDLEASSITGTSARIDWVVKDATKYDWALKKGASFDGGTSVSSGSNLTADYKELTGLLAGTQYWFKLTAKNDCGATSKEKIINFTTKAEYVITYYKNDGSGTSETESKTEGVNYTISSDKFSRDGYTLSKWNTQAGGGGTDYTKGATYTTDAPLDLHAVWTANNYTITLNSNGGSGNPASVSATYGSAAPSVGTLPTKADKNFAGYWTGSGGTGTMVVDASGVWVAGISGYTDASKNWIGTEGKTIYAKWVDKTYTNYRTTCSETYDIVLHDNNGGSHNGSAKVADGGKLLTNIVAPTRDGYSIEGYYAEAGTSPKIADASGALQSDKTGYTDATGAWTKGDGATLYAKWTATNYTITYDGLEGASNSNPTSYNIATPTITLVTPGSREGYTFAGWTCGGTPITQIAVGSTGDKTITATWTANTYTVQFNANGGGGSMSPQNFTYGVAQSLTSNGFTAPSEKSFGGWTTNSDGTGDFYTNGQSVSNLTSENGATVQLYAKWVDCDLYTVTLKVNGDTWKTVTQGSCDASIDLSSYQDVPSCDAKYTFVGWSTTNSGISTTAPTIAKTSSYTPESDVTLYAVYSYSAKMGTLVKSTTGFGGVSKKYIVVAPSKNIALAGLSSSASVSIVGDYCYVTSGTPIQFNFTDAGSSKWFMYNAYDDDEDEQYDYNYYCVPTGSSGQFSYYNKSDFEEWYVDYYDEYVGEDDLKYQDYYGDWRYDYNEIEDFIKTYFGTQALWTVSFDASGVATLTANSKTLKKKSSGNDWKAYADGQTSISLYEYADGTAYTTQPDMTYYTITKGATTNGSISISKGVVCSGSVDVVATADPGYTFSGWSVTSGSGSFGSTSSTSTTFTPSANATITATFVAATPHDITWMVNGVALTSGAQTASLTAGTSFSTMTLPTAPANNTLSSACSAVANQFVGWSKTDMGFATGQSAPQLFTNAAGAGATYGVMGGEDVVFYAVFAQDGSSNYMSRCANTYNITLDKKEGTTDGSATATEMGTSLTDIVAPTRTGYSIEGYYAETGRTTKIVNANGTLVSDKAGYTDATGHWINTTSPLTLYTQWNIITYNLTYENLNGASNSNPATYQVTTVTIVLADPGSRTGYTFAGWTCGGDAITQIALGSTGDKTITANWTANNYNITYKDKDDAAYSGDKTDGRPTGLPAQHTYGSATELNDGTRTGYRFDGWYTSSNCSTGKVTSLGATDYTSAITLYAKWTASHTYSFSKNGVVDGTLQKGAVEGETVTMPNTTVNCGLWTTFEGWVESDVAETTTEPTMYKAGDVYVVPVGSGDKTFKAVYSKHEGDGTVSYEKVTSGHKSGTYIMVSSNDLVYTGQHSGSGTTDYGDNTSVIQSAGVVTAANLPNTAKEVTVRIGKGGSINNTFAIQIPSAKYLSATNGNYLNSDITDVKSAYVWKFDNGTDSYGKSGSEKTGSAGAIRSTTQTTRVIQPNGDRFACYEHTYTNYVYLYRKKVAGTTYYTTAPASCAVPTQITVSYNDNKSHAGDQTITGMPSGTTLDFTSYPNFDSYTIGAAPTDPTGYHFAGWNTQADGNGDDYAAGASVTTFGYRETITLYAKWERVYTVTLYDNGVERTRLTQASAGANVTLPSGNNCGVGSAFTFVGWTDSPVQLNAEPVRPNIVSGAGEWGDDELTDDITLYSVYSKSVDGCDDFAAGVSGAYKFTDKASGEYALTTGTTNSYNRGSSGDAEVFYIGYSPAKSAYTIRTSTGYLGWFGASGSEALTKGNTTPYYWNITAGTGTNSGYWYFEPVEISGRQFSGNSSSKFQLHGNSTKYYIQLTKMAMTYYYNTAICEEAQITFHDGGGAISGTPTTPAGASWNSGTHVLSGLEDCDKITTFPTASYDGWTFIGWSTEDYSNSGKHTADHAEENASTDEPDGSIIYKTGGNPYVVRGGSIDLYPIFTRFPDNEPFNTESGGDYYIYYLKPGTDDGYGANIRVYATAYDGEKRYGQTTSCAAATEFTFTKDGNVWHIYDKTTSKYVAGKSLDDWLVHANDLSGALDDWTITIKSGNQFYASCQGGGRYITFSTSANYFMDYSTSANPGICLPVYLGSCTERIFSSEPNPTPTIDLTGEPMVTSSVGQQVRATETMTLSAAHLASVPANKIIVSGTNLKFATTASATTSTTLSLSLTDGNLAATTIYVYYTPTVTEDGLENIVVTAKAYYTTTPKDVQTTGIVHARHLPADFVIAAKASNGKWYALPADITSSKSLTDGVLIEVDNANDPTEATAAPNNTKWGLRNVKSGRQTGSGVGDNLVFTERLTTATPNEQKTLYNGSGTSIQVYAQYSGYDGSNPAKYEWVVTESNLKDYTLTSASESRTLSLGTNGKFGALTIAKEYEGKLRLLPAEFYVPAEMQVLEWKANSVVVMYTGTQTTATTKVGTNTKSSAQTLASQKLTHGIYELTTSQSLVANSGAKLEMVFGSDAEKMIVDIPVIINSASTATDGHAAQDVVIVKGGKLTAATTQHNYRNVYVYGGGKLKIESGKSLGVNNIILRAGGISTDGSGGSAVYDYVYPQVELGGTLESAADSIQYEYITDYDHWYQFCLPFNAKLSSIHYPQEYYGDNVTATNTGSWVIKRYAGEVRATGNYNAWVDIESESATSVTAGHGYIYWGAPKKVTIGGDKQRQLWGIQRITMPVTAAAATTAETADKNISVDSYSDVEGKSTKPNDQGWNLVGNPYMVDLTNLSSESMIAGQLVHTETVPWDGKWRNNGDGIRYVTIPDYHFDNYKAKTASVASGEGDFMPGRAFFVQIAEGASTLTFAAANRASLMPALYAKVEESVDIETGIVLSDESKHDEVNFWLKDGKTEAYEYNADYPKTMNTTNFNIYGVHSHGELSWVAISPEIAEGSMAIGYQVPAAGEYRLSLSETYVSDKIDQLLVTDHEMSPDITTNLLTEDYVFQVNQAETNNTRFTVSIRLAPQTPTDIGNVPSEGMNADNAKPQKFIYHDKLYILRNGVIYDATGKQVKGGLK